MDIAFNNDQMRARTAHAAHNLATLKHMILNLIRMDPVKRKGSIKTRRIIAATSDNYRAHLCGLEGTEYRSLILRFFFMRWPWVS